MTHHVESTTYCGEVLDRAINEVQYERKPLIDNFLYEKSALMLYADDGSGKSALCLQTCLQATVGGSKLFGEFDIPKACKVLYFQMERHPDESFERIKHLRQVIPFDNNNFIISVSLQGINLQEPEGFMIAMQRVEEIIGKHFTPDIIAIDPIYPLVMDDLSTASACNAVTNFFRTLQLRTNATILATTHTNRGVRDKETHQRVGKDMYGSRFLSAFFTGSYHVEIKPDGEGTKFKLDKNSQRNLEKKFGLIYDAASYCSWIEKDGNLTKKDKLDNFINTCKMTKKEFSFADMKAISDLSDSALRGYLSGHLKDKLKIVHKASRGKVIYAVL